MDLSIRSTPGGAVQDHSWLAGDSSAFETAQSGTLDVSALTAGTHYDSVTKVIPSGLVVTLDPETDMFVPFDGVSEVQTVTITGGPTGGTFTLTFDGEVTAAIAYNATAAAVQSALEALSNVTPGDIVVSGSAGGPYTLTFGGAYSEQNVPAVTANASLTGGSTPGVTIATPTAGVTGGIDGFVAQNVDLSREDGTLPTRVIFARIVDAVIVPSRLPVAAQRTINQNTPTSGKFAFVN